MRDYEALKTTNGKDMRDESDARSPNLEAQKL